MPYCPECGLEVSNDVTTCPNCGYPLESNTLPIKKLDKRTRAVESNEKSYINQIIIASALVILFFITFLAISSLRNHQKFLNSLIENSYIGYVYTKSVRLVNEAYLNELDHSNLYTIKELPFGAKVNVSKLPNEFAEYAFSYLAVIENKKVKGYVHEDNIMKEEDFLRKKKNEKYCELPGSLERYYVIVEKGEVKKESSLNNNEFRFLPFGTSVLAHPVSKNPSLMVCVDDNRYGDNNTFIGYMHESNLGKMDEYNKKRDLLKNEESTTDTNLDTAKCYALYDNMVEAMENAASAANAKDYCKAADQIEIALNFADSALPYCNENRRETIRDYISDLVKIFPVYISECGH